MKKPLECAFRVVIWSAGSAGLDQARLPSYGSGLRRDERLARL